MSGYEWGSDMSRWCITYTGYDWQVCSPHCKTETQHSTFPEAHAVYLDAVTCDVLTPFAYYTEPRCSRARGHEGAHRFVSKNPEHAPLHVNPK